MSFSPYSYSPLSTALENLILGGGQRFGSAQLAGFPPPFPGRSGYDLGMNELVMGVNSYNPSFINSMAPRMNSGLFNPLAMGGSWPLGGGSHGIFPSNSDLYGLRPYAAAAKKS